MASVLRFRGHQERCSKTFDLVRDLEVEPAGLGLGLGGGLGLAWRFVVLVNPTDNFPPDISVIPHIWVLEGGQ